MIKIISNYFKEKRFIDILPWVWLFVSYFATFIFIYVKCRYYVESDMASEMILANLLNEENSIISTNWFYSSEIRIFYLQIIYRLTLLIFPNHWYVARVVGQAIWMALLLLSYFFVCGKRGLDLNNKGVWGGACLACPFGIWYFWYGAFGGFYIPHMMLVLISLGLVIRIYKSDEKKNTIIYGILMAIVSFVNGLGSVKGIMAIYAPLCLASFVMIAHKLHEYPNEKPKKEIKLLISSIISLCISCIGCLINFTLLANKYCFSTNHGRAWGKLDLTYFLSTISDFLAIFGVQHPSYWNTGISLFSINGLLGAFAYVNIALLVISVVILFKNFKKLNFNSKFISILFVCVLFVQSCVFALTQGADISSQSYWLTPMPLAFVLMCVAFENADLRWKYSRIIIPLILMISISSTSIASLKTYLDKALQSRPELKEVYEFLSFNNYTQGCATFWNGNVLTEWSSGNIQIWDVEFDDWGFTRLNKWLQLKKHINHPEGEFFILTTEEELLNYNSINILEYVNIVYNDEHGYIVMIFKNYQELLDAAEKAGLTVEE